jgi:hypothetical protein
LNLRSTSCWRRAAAAAALWCAAPLAPRCWGRAAAPARRCSRRAVDALELWQRRRRSSLCPLPPQPGPSASQQRRLACLPASLSRARTLRHTGAAPVDAGLPLAPRPTPRPRRGAPQVYRALCKPFNEHVAVKRIDLDGGNIDLAAVCKEATFMRRLYQCAA